MSEREKREARLDQWTLLRVIGEAKLQIRRLYKFGAPFNRQPVESMFAALKPWNVALDRLLEEMK